MVYPLRYSFCSVQRALGKDRVAVDKGSGGRTGAHTLAKQSANSTARATRRPAQTGRGGCETAGEATERAGIGARDHSQAESGRMYRTPEVCSLAAQRLESDLENEKAVSAHAKQVWLSRMCTVLLRL